MQNFLELLFDSQIALRGNVILGCILLAIFIFYFFSKEGRDERGRKIIAIAALCSFVTLFVVLNMIPFFVTWMMDNEIRLANVIQSAYTIVLLVADIAILIVRKLKLNQELKRTPIKSDYWVCVLFLT